VIRSNGRKKSTFLAQDSVPADAHFDYVSDATNYRISKADLYADIEADIVESSPAKGFAYLSANATVTALTEDVYADIAGTWVLSPLSEDFSITGSELTYEGDTTKTFQVDFACSVTPASDTPQIVFSAFKEGVKVIGLECERTLENNRYSVVSIVGLISLEPGDTFKVRAVNLSNNVDMTVIYAQLRLS
jgi:hypothetical protein